MSSSQLHARFETTCSSAVTTQRYPGVNSAVSCQILTSRSVPGDFASHPSRTNYQPDYHAQQHRCFPAKRMERFEPLTTSKHLETSAGSLWLPRESTFVSTFTHKANLRLPDLVINNVPRRRLFIPTFRRLSFECKPEWPRKATWYLVSQTYNARLQVRIKDYA